MRVEAVVVQGGGWASGRSNPDRSPGTIERQKPFLTKYVDVLDGCHNGTINLMLDFAIEIRQPDVVTEPIIWKQQLRGRGGEIFEITEVGLEVNNDRYRAWVYTPHNSPHRTDPRIVELLAQHIKGLALGTRCAVLFKSESQAIKI